MKASLRLQQSRFVRLLVTLGLLIAVGQNLSLTTATAKTLPASLTQTNVSSTNLTQQVALNHNGKLVAPLDTTQQLTFVIALKERDSQAFTQFLTDLYDPASPNFRHFISSNEYAAQFAPDAQTRQQITNYLQSQGFAITSNQQNSSTITFRGTVGQAQNAFGVRLGRYQRADGTSFFANDRTPALAPALAAQVVDVFGLSNEFQLHTNYQVAKDKQGRAVPHRGPQNNGYTPTELRRAYNIPDSYTGAGRVIGLYELGGYNPQNIDVYDQSFGLPAGNRANVSVDGQTCAANDGSVQEEVELDIEIANAIAPQAKVVVYCGQYANGGFADYLNVYQAIATDTVNHPDVVSESYGQDETIFTAQGLTSYLEAEGNYLRQLAAQGVSFFASSGDSGSESGDHTTIQTPQDPAAQPYLTSVGGTTLFVNGNGNNTSYNTETIWNNGVNGGGGSGGISNYWSKSTVPWQQGPGVNNAYAATKPNRQFPDVAGDADPVSGYAIYTFDAAGGTNWYTFGGTSCASPLWAAIATDAVAVKGGRLGLLNPALYSVFQNGNKYNNDFHDVTRGNNDLLCPYGQTCQDSKQGGPFYPATPGYDLASGIGSPNVAKLVPDLVNVTPGPYLATNSVVKLGADVNGSTVSQPISLTTYGGTASVAYSTTISNGSWLSLTPASGTVANGSQANLTLTATPGSLAAGTYTATVTFSGTAGSTTTPTFTMTVYLTVGALHVSSNALTFTASDLQGSANPPAQTIVLTTTSTTPQTYVLNVQDFVGFVTIDGVLYDAVNPFGVPGAYQPVTTPFTRTVSASNPVTVSVGVSLTAPTTVTATSSSGVGAPLAPAKYQANIYFLRATDPNAVPVGADEKQTNITFNVQGQVLTTNVLTAFFGTTNGGTPPTSQVINLSESGFGTANAAVPFSATVVSLDGTSWLTVTPTSGTVPAGGSVQLTLSADPSGLPPGIYQAEIVINSTNSNTVTVVGVTLRVNPQPHLNIPTNDLVFNLQIGSTAPVTQTFTIGATDAPPGGIDFQIAKTGRLPAPWLSVTPVTGTVTSTVTPDSNPTVISVSVNPALITGTVTPGLSYNTYLLVFDNTNPTGDSVARIPVLVNFVAPYSYPLPFLSSGAFSTTTFVTAQNLSNSSATVSLQFYDANGATLGTPISSTIPANGQVVLPNNVIPANSYGSAIVSSTAQLNLIVTEGASGGSSGKNVLSSAYNVSPNTSPLLYNPIASNGNFGFNTSTFVYNAGTVTATGTIQYYDQNGTPGPSDVFTVTPHAGQTFNQAGRNGLANNLSYWSVISATNPSSQLVVQVTETSSRGFLATYEATPRPSQTLYAPTAYNNGFGSFNTGSAFANPNPMTATVQISFYDANSGTVSTTQTLTIPPFGVGGSYTPAVAGIPAGFVGSAIISSTQPLVATVNEQGAPGSGTYVALSQAGQRVGLPAVFNGAFGGFVSGATLLNVTNQTIHVTLQYYDQGGNALAPGLNYTVQPHASVLAFQGTGSSSAPPAGFFGTAVLTSDTPNSLVATTNAAANGLFYTYTEPAQ